MDREKFSNYQTLAEQQTPKVHDSDFDSKSQIILILALRALCDCFWFSVLVRSSWWLLVLTPGSALPLFWGFSLGKHLQFVMWQIWYHHMRYYKICASLGSDCTFKATQFLCEVLTVNKMLQYQHGGTETSAALEFAVNTLQV
jgi:hypothetical protein